MTIYSIWLNSKNKKGKNPHIRLIFVQATEAVKLEKVAVYSKNFTVIMIGYGVFVKALFVK